MAYFDVSRSRKHGQTGQLSMDEQLAAVVLATLSGRPASLPGGPGALVSSHMDQHSAGHEGVLAGQAHATLDSSLCGCARCCPASDLKGSEDTVVSADTASGRYMCLWKGCGAVTVSCSEIECHVRQKHLRAAGAAECSNREEDFYYVELDATPAGESRLVSSTEGHPRHSCTGPEIAVSLPHDSVLFDHDYQKKSCKALTKECGSGGARLKTLLPSSSLCAAVRPLDGGQGQAVVDGSWRRKPSSKLSLSGFAKKGDKHEMKKCRKVYGMTNKRLWCTQCKWKKACSRFMLRTF